MSGGGVRPPEPEPPHEPCARSYSDPLIEIPADAHGQIRALVVGSEVDIAPHPERYVVQVHREGVLIGILANRELYFCLGRWRYSASIHHVRLDERNLSNSEIWIRSVRHG